jgi:hypothetical protein
MELEIIFKLEIFWVIDFQIHLLHAFYASTILTGNTSDVDTL